MDDFDWRLSVAEVTSHGPFSLFPGVDRHLMVLAGRMSLIHGAGAEQIVDADDLPYSFPGDQPTFGQPVGGPVRDLNLMVRRGAHVGSLRRITGGVFTSDADVTIVIALERVEVSAGTSELMLVPFDALVLPNHISVRGDRPLAVAEIWTAY